MSEGAAVVSQVTMELATCRACGAPKPLDEFYSAPNKGRRRRVCDTCRLQEIRVRYAQKRATNTATAAVRVARCALCREPMPRGRKGACCSRECLLLSVGLPPDFDPQRFGVVGGPWLTSTISPAAEAEMRLMLHAVMVTAREKRGAGQ